MIKNFGSKLSELRKRKGYTQEELAEILGVSAQAVSKWENDLSYPDITLLPEIAQLFNVSLDELLNDKAPETVLVPEQEKKDLNQMVLRIVVNSNDGDKVKVNLPMSLIKLGLEIGMQMPQVSNNESLKNIDFKQILNLVESGVIGKIVEVESADGDFIEIIVE